VKIAGADPDFHRRDLFEAIQRGDFPEWELGIQAFDQAFADSLPFDVLDPTKIIPKRCCRSASSAGWCWIAIPDNFFAETEQVAYCPANMPPGIDFTNDPLLQGACSPISTPRRAAWARPISTSCRSTRPSAR
jgi:catalase